MFNIVMFNMPYSMKRVRLIRFPPFVLFLTGSLKINDT